MVPSTRLTIRNMLRTLEHLRFTDYEILSNGRPRSRIGLKEERLVWTGSALGWTNHRINNSIPSADIHDVEKFLRVNKWDSPKDIEEIRSNVMEYVSGLYLDFLYEDESKVWAGLMVLDWSKDEVGDYIDANRTKVNKILKRIKTVVSPAMVKRHTYGS